MMQSLPVALNLGPQNPALITEVQARIDALQAVDPNNTQLIPVDLVTSSGSGLDPDISPAAAYYQVPTCCPGAESLRKRCFCTGGGQH